MDRSELKIEIADIECFYAMFCYCGWNKQEGKNYQYEISARVNELDGLVKHLIDGDLEFIIAYNGVRYDGQIIQYILDNYEQWHDKSAQEIVTLISEFSSETISLSNYDLPVKYKEHFMDIKIIDPFKVHHYDNKNRRVGLKNLEFAMDLPNIQEIPIDFRKPTLNVQEMDMVISYCWNDVDALKKFWDITVGETDSPMYKGEDMVQIRLDVMSELGFKWNCLNWSNSKMGDEINKKGYMEETGCTYDDLYKKKKNRKPTAKFTFGSCIPEYIEFNSQTMKDLVKQVKNVIVSLQKDNQEFIIKYGNTTYSVMRGGIHSHDSARILESSDKYLLRDADIGGQYPRTIVKRKLYPTQLGPKWLTMYEKQGLKRNEFKSKSRGSPKYMGLQKAWKEVLNAGGSTRKFAV